MAATETNTLERIKLKTPSIWTVVFHNDDYTPVDFVMWVLVQEFNLDLMEAEEITMKIHHEGKGRVGSFTKEIAMTKAAAVVNLAAQNEHPLLATPEEQ
jgi:ATP-dependent Clp protease adaptor protein ClpS